MGLLQKEGMYINIKKSSFGRNEIRYLGFCINENGVSIGKEGFEAVQKLRIPTDVPMLRRFL